MKRFLRLFCAATLALAPAFASAAEKKPDILIFMADDHSQYDSSAYGNEHVPTPQMEKLAAEGITLTHCFTATPACAPSRASLLTGLMPARNGAEDNHTFPKAGTRSLVSDLKAAGYTTAAIGKIAHGQPRSFDFDFVQPNTGHDPRPAVTEYLAKRDKTKPLVLFVGTSDPHVPWPEPQGFKPKDVDLTPHLLDTPMTRRHRAAYYTAIRRVDDLLGWLRETAAREMSADLLFLYTADHGGQWPFGKWTLYDYGTRVPFIAAWPGHIQAGTESDAMVLLQDTLPTLLDVAGGKAPDGIDGKSFLPVLEGKAEGHRQKIFLTHSGDKEMNVYPIRAIRSGEWKLIHNLHPEFAFTNHSDLHRRPLAGAYWNEWAELYRNGDANAKTIVEAYYKHPKWELYRVVEDRWETENRIDDAALAPMVAEMKEELAEWMKAQGDMGRVFNDPRPLEKPETWAPEFFDTRKPNKP